MPWSSTLMSTHRPSVRARTCTVELCDLSTDYAQFTTAETVVLPISCDFVPALKESPMRERQEYFYREQLKLARKHQLPVMLHVRRSADKLLRHLRELRPEGGWHGIGHAFNGSEQQAMEFIKLGFKLGFGGNLTFDSALQIRRLARSLPLDALVMETDSPDIAPHWLYRTAAQRAGGQGQGRNEPGELPRIAGVLAQLRGMTTGALQAATTANALQAFPGLRELVPC